MVSNRDKLWRDGVAVLPHAFEAELIDLCAQLCEPLLSDQTRPGVRRVLEREPRLADLVHAGPVRDLITSIGGESAIVVRSIVFDKNAHTNWLVPWHQDPTIAVAERIDAPGFVNWNIKDGELHCQPPLDVLERMFTVRIHLDRCTAESGPLRVVAGSHRHGLLSRPEIETRAARGPVVEAITERGGVALMTPLSVHSSPKATNPTSRRRVLHLECSISPLPHGLRWAQA